MESNRIREQNNSTIMPYVGFAFADVFGRAFAEEMLELFESRSFALQCLRSSDRRKRSAALEVLLKCWNLRLDMKRSICTELISDPHVDVRSHAIGCLGDVLKHSNDMDSCRYLATIALDDARPNCERRAAYKAILRIRPPQIDSMSAAGLARHEDEMCKRLRELEETMKDLLPDMDTELLRTLTDVPRVLR